MNLSFRFALSTALGLMLAGCDGESSDTSSAATQAGETEPNPETSSGSGSATDDTEGCSAAAVADASFSFDFSGWQELAESDGQFSFEGSAPCSVVSVETGGGGLTTMLECTSEAGDFAGEISVASTDAGSPAWIPAQEVTMRLREQREGVNYATLELRGEDESLLLAALTTPTLGSSEFWHVDGALDPLATAVDREVCGGQEGDGVSVEFSSADDSLALFGGERGVLPSGENTSLAIDLEVARVAACCSADLEFQLLIRRVEI